MRKDRQTNKQNSNTNETDKKYSRLNQISPWSQFILYECYVNMPNPIMMW